MRIFQSIHRIERIPCAGAFGEIDHFPTWISHFPKPDQSLSIFLIDLASLVFWLSLGKIEIEAFIIPLFVFTVNPSKAKGFVYDFRDRQTGFLTSFF